MVGGSVCTDESQPTAAHVSFLAEHPRSPVMLLSQFLVRCPSCQSVAALHVDEQDMAARVIVRFICARSCSVEASRVRLLLPELVPSSPEELVA